LAKRRILGLDSLRFICALWVVLHHGARPEIAAWMGWGDIAVPVERDRV
jgi:peptidoglycan/LPS O-acetylase OafA/YrhL